MQDSYSSLRSHGFADILREHRRSRPDMLAAIDGDLSLTWRELDARVNRVACALRGRGLGKGDRVLWIGQNSVKLFELLLACAKIGAFICPANWRMTAYEIRWTIADFDPRLIVWQEAELGQFRDRMGPFEREGRIWLQHDGDGTDSYQALLDEGVDEDLDDAVDPETALLGIYTAAFSGRPGAAMLSHTALVLNAMLIMYAQRVDESVRFLVSGPMFHVGVLLGAFATYAAGGALIFIARVDATEMLELIHEHRVTNAFIVQPTLVQMKAIAAETDYDLTSLFKDGDLNRWTSPQVLREDAPMKRLPGVYGQTEVTGNLLYVCFGGSGAGRSNPFAQVRIVDDNDNELPVGVPGEIVARGPLVMLGYYNRPEINAERSRGGWHHTHDLGVRNADGSISFVSPKTTMIKSGVENVYPAEVETCIKDHSAVEDACVIGVPDPQWDQNVKALVVLKPDAIATAQDLIEHCKERMASYKKPKIVVFVEALPRRADGRVDHDAADAAHGGGGYPGVGARANLGPKGAR